MPKTDKDDSNITPENNPVKNEKHDCKGCGKCEKNKNTGFITID